MITDVYGESGSGKTQLCFTAAVNCIKKGGRVLFVDTAGTFRPERILEISRTSEVLGHIKYLRALGTRDQIAVVHQIADLGPQLVVIDTVTGLFSSEYSGPARHLAVMKHLRDLAVGAITSRCAIMVTNMIRNAPAVLDRSAGKIALTVVPSQQREFLGSSVSIYSHFKLKFEIVDPKRSLFRAKLIQPPKPSAVEFRISDSGVADTG
jgi:RecA/RadA recombinase